MDKDRFVKRAILRIFIKEILMLFLRMWKMCIFICWSEFYGAIEILWNFKMIKDHRVNLMLNKGNSNRCIIQNLPYSVFSPAYIHNSHLSDTAKTSFIFIFLEYIVTTWASPKSTSIFSLDVILLDKEF